MDQNLDKAVELVNRTYGKNTILPLGSTATMDVDTISTGVLSVDVALGVGGVPRGRVVEVYGVESGGKTTLALHIIASAQRDGGAAAFIDAEHALDPVYARKLGVDVDHLLVSQPDNGEQALEIVEILIKSGACDVIVVDSVAALVPKAELEGNMGDPQMGLQARLMSQALRKLTAITSKSKTCLIFINQIREKIGVLFGSPETTVGGRALKFYASVRIDVRKTSAVKDGEERTGNQSKITISKNKLAAPFRIATPDLVYGEGFSKIADLLTLGIEHDIVEKSGAWLTVEGQKVNGTEAARRFLKDNPEAAESLEFKLRERLFPERTI